MKLTFQEYEERARTTAQYPAVGKNIIYPTLGLNGEAGEVAEKVKKMIRDRDGVLDIATEQAIAKEIGDVLWYCAMLAHEIGIPLEFIATMNLNKLADRKKRDAIGGSGDDR